VVASDGVNPISYVYANGEGTCVLVCHGVKHPAQSVSAVRRTGPAGVK